MAERRMFAKTIVLSDAFLDMPMSARNLYFTLGMVADDDGFVNNPRSIMRQCGASDGDMHALLNNKFVILFETGVIVIKHWRINNYLRSDRYVPTKYHEEKDELTVDENGSYHLTEKAGIPDGIPSNGIPRIGKDSLVEGSVEEDRLVKEENNTSFFLSEKNSQNSDSGNPNPEAQIKYWRDRVDLFKRQGFETDGIYSLAAANGVSREEIDSYEETGS